MPLIEKTHETLSKKERGGFPLFCSRFNYKYDLWTFEHQYGLKGPNLATVTACTSGLHAIGLAYRLIQTGDADAMLAGGSESTVSPLGIGGFAARALSTRECEPEKPQGPLTSLETVLC